MKGLILSIFLFKAVLVILLITAKMYLENYT